MPAADADIAQIPVPGGSVRIPRARLPVHIAVIMDGNGRWAKKRLLNRFEGHRAGARAVREAVTACREWGIAHLTLYAFSMENWRRPAGEVERLWELLAEFLASERRLMIERSIRLSAIGEIDRVPPAARAVLDDVMAATAGGTALQLTLALSYGSRPEIVRAARKAAAAGEITEESLGGCLDTAGAPDPDLFIRTGGEHRLSNFLLWQSSYAELYFTPVLWPDFSRAELGAAVADYAGRERRFGASGGL